MITKSPLSLLCSFYCTQVEILVGDVDEGGDDDPVVDDDGGDDDAVVVEASTLATVTATADLYDPNPASANGCDPDGCTAALTRVRRV